MHRSFNPGRLRLTLPLLPSLLGFAATAFHSPAATLLLDTTSVFSGGQAIGSAAAGVGLPPPPSAGRVGGAISGSVQPTVEAPSASLSTPSQSASNVVATQVREAESSSTPRGNSSSSRRSSRSPRSGPSPRSSRPEASTPQATPSASPLAPLTTSGKEPLPVVTNEASASNWLVTVDTAWLSDFYFRGLNVLDRVSPTDTDNGVWKNSIEGTYFWGKNALKLGFGYIYSLNDQLPNGDSAEFSRRSNPDFTELQKFAIAPTDRYTELNFAASYSRQFLENEHGQAFLGTIGLAHYRFSNPQFWNSGSGPIRSTSELQAGLAYIGLGGQNSTGTLSWSLQPALNYAYDFDNFEGHFLEFGVSSEITIEPLKLRFAPRIGVSYDIGYNGPDNGWNNLETSLSISRPLNKHLSLNLIGGYNHDLGDDTPDGRRTDSGWFGGVTITALLGPWLASDAPAPGYTAGKGGKDIILPEPAERPRWSFSAGAGYRQIDASFRSKPVDPYNALGLVKRQQGGGSLETGITESYLNGETFEDAGVGTTFFLGGSSIGSLDTFDQQVIFESRRYAYRDVTKSRRYNAEDDDEILFPYIKLSYDIIDTPTFSVGAGLQYAYSRADLDSGLAPVTFSQGFERTSNFGFIYDHDPFFTPANGYDPSVIYDAQPYADYIISLIEDFYEPDDLEAVKTYLNSLNPQKTRQDIENEVVRVAGFLQSKLDVKMHEITFPVSFTYKANKRFELSVSAGPTLNLFDVELDSTVHFQALDNLSGGRTLIDQRQFLSRSLDLNNVVAERDPVVSSRSTTAASANSAASAQARSAGGKGALNTTHPRLPGRTVAVARSSRSDQHLTWGVMGQGTLTFYLNEKQTWALDLWGRYNYVNPFTVSNDFTSAEIDASSWSAGVGVVYRF